MCMTRFYCHNCKIHCKKFQIRAFHREKLYVIENSPYGHDFNRKSQIHNCNQTSLMYVGEHLLYNLTTAALA